MTHDLLKNVLLGLQVRVHKVVVCDLKEDTFYAADLDGARWTDDVRGFAAQRRASARTSVWIAHFCRR